MADGKLFQPVDTGWTNIVFVCVTPKGGECEYNYETPCKTTTDINVVVDVFDKRREETGECSGGKSKRVEKTKCSDLIVLGLPWKTSEQELRTYFEPFGEVLMAQVQ